MNSGLEALHTHFKHLRTQLDAMRLLLERESEQLTQRDADGLRESSREKTLLAEEIDRITAAQNALLASFKLASGREGLETLLAALPAHAPITLPMRTLWKEIRELGEECNRLNDVNGAYIGLLGKHVERSLDLLHGRDAQEFVYGPDGGNRKPRASRKLISV